MAFAVTTQIDGTAPENDGAAVSGCSQGSFDCEYSSPQGAIIRRVSLSNFRSYKSARIDLPGDARPIILTGENGAGKTNVLEALSFLSPGPGLRRAPLADVGNIEADSAWAVATQIQIGTDKIGIGTGLQEGMHDTGNPLRRTVRVDGIDQSGQSALSDALSVIWLTPQMDRLFTEGASSRRRFFDRMALALHSDHGRQVSAYERAMRERNKLLADSGEAADPAWLNALEARMAEHGIATAVARLDYAGQLAGQIACADDSAFPKATLAIDGWLENRVASALPAHDIELEYIAALKTARPSDAASGRATIGAHKMDLIVTHTAKAMPAEKCSTGEQKALLISLVLAGAQLRQAVTGTAPLILLDEVAAHLDESRRAALFDALVPTGAQCWMTGTDKSLFNAIKDRGLFFDVADGCINPAHDQ